MPDLNVTSSGVATIATSSGNQLATVTGRGVAGAAITPGQVVFADPSAGNLIKPAQANSTNQQQAANVVGIALNSAALNQPVTYATGGDLILPTTGAVGVGLTSGSVYILSASAPGNLVSTADALAAGNYVSVIGTGNGTVTNTTTTVFRMGLIAVAAPR